MLYSDAASRLRAHVAWIAAAIILAAGALDFVQVGEFPALPLLVRVVWASAMALAAYVIPRVSSIARDRVLIALAALSVVCWLALTLLTAGAEGAYFWWMLALPLMFGALTPDNLPATSLAGAGTLLGNLFVLWSEGAAPTAYFTWLVIALSTFGLSTASVLGYRRLLDAETALERARADAERELAMSEQRRAHAEKLALIGRLAAGIAHEINNPLAYVKANLAHLDRERTGSLLVSDLEALLAESQMGLARIEQIVADLRSFARVDEPTLTPCDIRAIVEEAVRISSVRTREVAVVDVEVQDALPAVTASHNKLVQVFVNLLVNAADAVAEGGRGPRWIRIEAASRNGTVEVRVSDSGPGIPQEILPRLFEPFFTTKADGKGTGLGLSLAREFVEGYGGTIEVENAPNAGASFRIRLPAAPAAIRAA